MIARKYAIGIRKAKKTTRFFPSGWWISPIVLAGTIWWGIVIWAVIT